MLFVENAILMLAFLKILVMKRVSRPVYVNLAHLWFVSFCFGFSFLCLILSRTASSYTLVSQSRFLINSNTEQKNTITVVIVV